MGVIEAGSDGEVKLLLDSGRTVVVDWHATWCGPCKKIAPIFASLAAAHPDLSFMRVDIDTCEGVSEELGVVSMPTFHWWSGGTKHGEVMGADEEKLRAMVAAAAAGSGPGPGDDAAPPATAPPVRVQGSVLEIFGRAMGQSGLKNFTRQPSGGVAAVETAGLKGSDEFHRSQGMTDDMAELGITDGGSVRNDRALCCQSTGQLDQLCADFPKLVPSFRVPCAFGQNLTIDGLSSQNLCVGDVFEVVAPTSGGGAAAAAAAGQPR